MVLAGLGSLRADPLMDPLRNELRFQAIEPRDSEPPVYQLLLQPLRQLRPVAEVPTVSARAANDSLSVYFRMAACSTAKLLPEPERCSVLAGLAGGSSHFVTSYPSWMAVPIRVVFQEG